MYMPSPNEFSVGECVLGYMEYIQFLKKSTTNSTATSECGRNVMSSMNTF